MRRPATIENRDHYARDRDKIKQAIENGGKVVLSGGLNLKYWKKEGIILIWLVGGKRLNGKRIGTVINQIQQIGYRTGRCTNNLTFSVIPIWDGKEGGS